MTRRRLTATSQTTDREIVWVLLAQRRAAAPDHENRSYVATALIVLFAFAFAGYSQTPDTNQDRITPDFRVQVWGFIGADSKRGLGTISTYAPTWKRDCLLCELPYPKKRPLSTVPPNILAVLPTLPTDIQYRFLGRDLILHDTRANIVLDRMPYAIQCIDCDELTRDR